VTSCANPMLRTVYVSGEESDKVVDATIIKHMKNQLMGSLNCWYRVRTRCSSHLETESNKTAFVYL